MLLQELLASHTPVYLKWRALRHCLVSGRILYYVKKICPSFPIPSLKILLRNGVLLTFTVAKHSGDIERVTVDRSLVNRLPSSIQSGTC